MTAPGTCAESERKKPSISGAIHQLKMQKHASAKPTHR
jgi:hypothetical protein